VYGGVIGAIVYLVARDRLSGMNPQYWYFWIGLMLIGVVLFLPSGILGGVAAARRILQPQSLNPRSGTAIR
jgi:branched-chain amino acid transport system permease protein